MRYSEEIYNKVFPREDEIPAVTDSAVEVPLAGDTVIDNDSTEDETIDDTVELCEEFKESLEDLDDCLFQEIFENLEDNKEFDRLLNLDKFTKEESIKVRKMINVASKHIAHKLLERISEYQELYAAFQNFQ